MVLHSLLWMCYYLVTCLSQCEGLSIDECKSWFVCCVHVVFMYMYVCCAHVLFMYSTSQKFGHLLITDHFESHRTFSTMQSSFRSGHGCTSATLKVLNDIITAINKRHYCAAVFIDLAKAFDSVNHHILIGRLNTLGFSNDCLAWFTNYFSDRVQFVKYEGLLFEPLAISVGMPQGSILGPTILLCIYQRCRSCWILNLLPISQQSIHPLMLPNIPS